MRRLRSILVTGGVGAALLAAGCSGDEPPTGPSAAVQTAKPTSTLKVTPPQVNLSGTGVSTTLSASSTSGPIAVAVSSPACVSVSLKNGPQNQAKFTVTAIAVGACTLTVTDGGTGSLQVPVRVAATATLVRSTLVASIYHTCGLDAAGAAYCWGYNGFGQTGSTTGLGSALANP